MELFIVITALVASVAGGLILLLSLAEKKLNWSKPSTCNRKWNWDLLSLKMRSW
jgi:hypothetical protein